MTRSPHGTTLRWLAFATLLLASAAVREGRSGAVDQAIIWLPTGTAIAGVFLVGLPSAALVAGVTFAQRMLIGYDWSVAVPAAVGSAVEALLGVLVLRRLGCERRLARLRDVGALFAAAAIAPLGSIVCSWLGRMLIWRNPLMPFFSGWDGWWRMNALGALTVVPIALTWLGMPRREVTPRRLGRVASALVGGPLFLAILFVGLPGGASGVMWLNLVLLSGVLYAAVRYGMRGATLGGTLAAVFVAVATANGHGPYVDLPRDQRHMAVQLFELTLLGIPIAFGALIAERHAAEERRRRSEDLLESINRNVVEGLFRASPALEVQYANPAFVQLFGDGRDSASGGAPAPRFVDPARRGELLARLAEQGRWHNEEVRFLRHDGTPFWGLLSGTAVRGPGGALLHVDGAISDVTQRKALEERFRDAQKMEAVGKLAGGVAHDFNNLLTVIMGYAEAIRVDAGERERVRAHAGHVLDASTRAAGLTRQLLAYSRRQVLLPQVLELGGVVDRMGHMLRRLIGEDVRCVVEHHSGPCWVRVDPSQIEQVLLNLVVNARDAMREGGTLTISTSLEEVPADVRASQPDAVTGMCVMLRVSDTGVGMTPEVRAQAFDPFFTTKAPGSGTGLGLATVHGIVKQSGGSIWLESAPGLGTTACIGLPRWEPPATRDEAPPAARTASRSGTVLVVEDEPAVRHLVCRTLVQRGYRVIEAADGAQGLVAAAAHEGPIDLVVSDVVMPVMGGREMAEQLAGERPRTRFLFISGYPNDARTASGGPRMTGHLLPKPFTTDQLVQCVEEILQSDAGATVTERPSA